MDPNKEPVPVIRQIEEKITDLLDRLNPTLTKDTVKETRYGVWGGNPSGTRYDPNCCAEEVTPSGTSFRVPSQCKKKPGFGFDGLYCKVHAKKHPAANQPCTIGFLALSSSLRIQKVFVVSETERTVSFLVSERNVTTQMKEAEHSKFFRTFAEAKKHLLDRKMELILAHKKQMWKLREDMREIEKLVES